MKICNMTLFKCAQVRLVGSVVFLSMSLTGAVNADEALGKADSGRATVASRVSDTTVRVAEPLTLELTVSAAIGCKVDFPSIGKTLGHFDVTDQIDLADVPSPNSADQRIWKLRLTLESIFTGDIEIPSLEIQVHHDTSSQTLISDAIPIRVTSVLEDRADPMRFRDIKSVIDVTVPEPVSRTWMWWTLGGFAGVAAVALMLVTISKRRTWMTPEMWANRELNQLRESEAMESLDSERVTETLTMILRDYLELQFDIAAPVQTTRELLQVVKDGNHMSDAMTKDYAKLFEIADLARFAGLRLSQVELIKAVDDTQRLIEQTSKGIQSLTQAGDSL